jgi:3-phenylpropionate/trans-cinnamate dioxygenase ferredoxin subunit
VTATITPTDNGPYRVQGEFRIVLPSGEELPIRQQVLLCRCGGSTRKPFCDGTHSRIGFQAATAAVQAEERRAG